MRVAYSDELNALVLMAPSRETYPMRMTLRDEGGDWDKKLGVWKFPATTDRLRYLEIHNPELDESVVDWNQKEAGRFAALLAARNITPSDRSREVFGKNGDQSLVRMAPYDHQICGAAFLAMSQSGMLLDKMGLGKTKQAIDAACWVMQRWPETRVVVVCPNSVKLNWMDEIRKHVWGGFGNSILPEGSSKRRIEFIHDWWLTSTGARWLILNYDTLRLIKDTFHEAVKGNILILDEAHRAKNGQAQVTKVLHSAKPRRIWLMTGTPVANRLEDLWSLCHLVKPGLLGWKYWGFSEKYLVRARNGMIVGYRNKQELQEKLASVAVTRETEQCLDVPAKVFSRVTVKLTKPEWKAYDTMKEELRAWFDQEMGEDPDEARVRAVATTFATRLIRLRQIADGFLSEGAGQNQQFAKDSAKVEALLSSFGDSGHAHAVVWTQFVPMGYEIARRSKFKTWVVDGNVPLHARRQMVAEWRGDGGLLVAQMATLGEGINLHLDLEDRPINLMYFMDCPWTPKTRSQCIGRQHGRIGQTLEVNIVDIVAAGTVDAKVLAKLQSKLEDAEEVTRLTRKDMEGMLE